MQVSCSIFLQVIITDAYSVIYGFQIEKSHSCKNLLFVENKKKNFLSYVHPFTYNAVTLFLSPWEIPVDINNTHICTNRLTARETLLINKKFILRFFPTIVEKFYLSSYII